MVLILNAHDCIYDAIFEHVYGDLGHNASPLRSFYSWLVCGIPTVVSIRKGCSYAAYSVSNEAVITTLEVP